MDEAAAFYPRQTYLRSWSRCSWMKNQPLFIYRERVRDGGEMLFFYFLLWSRSFQLSALRFSALYLVVSYSKCCHQSENWIERRGAFGAFLTSALLVKRAFDQVARAVCIFCYAGSILTKIRTSKRAAVSQFRRSVRFSRKIAKANSAKPTCAEL